MRLFASSSVYSHEIHGGRMTGTVKVLEENER